MKFYLCLIVISLLGLQLYGQESLSPQQILNAAKTEDDRVDAYQKLFKYYEFSQPDSAAWYLSTALLEFTEKDYKNGIASMTVLSAYFDVDHGQMASAREKQAKALAMFEAIGNKRGMASAHNGLGILDGKEGNFSESTRHFLTALKLFESLEDIDGIVNCYQKLGTVNEQANNLDQALRYYNSALRQMERTPVKGTKRIWIYNNIGVVYGKLGQMEKAKGFFEQALAESATPDKLDIRIMTLNNLGILYDKANENEKALKYFDEALAITKDKNLPENYTRLMVSKASVVSKSNPSKALEMLDEALATVKKLGLKSLEADIYDSMVETMYRLGKYKEALALVSVLRRLEDSLDNINKMKELMSLQSSYELERSNERLQQAEQKAQANKQLRDVIIGVAVILATMVVLLWLANRRSNNLNKQLKERENELKKSNETKDRLFSIIGHDLRGPIGNVPVMLQLLNDPTTSEDERQFLTETMIAHAQASKETLDKLLYWGQAQIKGIGINPATFTVGSAIDPILELVKTTADQKHITITDTIPGDIKILADPAHFEFLVRNIVSNALKFTNPGGRVVLSADVRQEPGFVVFSVADNGIGISPDRLPEIFTPLNSSTRGTADEKGTSIGLMLCREFVMQNGGKIWVESEPEKGTTFFFTLKAA